MTKTYIILAFLLLTNNTISSQICNFRYGYNGKPPVTVYSDSLDFIFKNNSAISYYFKRKIKKKYIQNNNDVLLFQSSFKYSKKHQLLISDVYLSNSNFKEKPFYKDYEIVQFDRINGNDTILDNFEINYIQDKNYIKELYYKLNEKKFLRFVTVTNDSLQFKILHENKLYTNFNKNKEMDINDIPAFILIEDLLNDFFPKDFEFQNKYFLKLVRGKYNTNSFLGTTLIANYHNCGVFEEVKDKISRRKKIAIKKDTILNTLNNYVERIAKDNDIVMFNEYHTYPHTRYNVMQSLKELKNSGFNYLGLEAINFKDNSKAKTGIVDISELEGYYIYEPTNALLMNYAQKLGFKLVAYEVEGQCDSSQSPNCRDSIQAINIANIYKNDKKAKIVILAGHAHIEKTARKDAWKFTRCFLDEFLPNKKILSIDQDKYITTNLNEEDIATTEALVLEKSDSVSDSYVISPYYKNYYSWYYSASDLMNNKVNFKLSNEVYYIEVLPYYKNKEVYLPLYKIEKSKLKQDFIFLPSNLDYKVIYKNKENKIIE